MDERKLVELWSAPITADEMRRQTRLDMIGEFVNDRARHIESRLKEICGDLDKMIWMKDQGWVILECPHDFDRTNEHGSILMSKPAYFAPPEAIGPNYEIDWSVVHAKGHRLA